MAVYNLFRGGVVPELGKLAVIVVQLMTYNFLLLRSLITAQMVLMVFVKKLNGKA